MLIYGLQSQETWVNKTYQRNKGQVVITDPKTLKSNRTVQMPDILCKEVKEFANSLYGITPQDSLFDVSKGYMHHEMDRGSQLADVKRISLYISKFNLCFFSRLRFASPHSFINPPIHLRSLSLYSVIKRPFTMGSSHFLLSSLNR